MNNENDNTRDNLRQAMAQNPYLQVMTQSGYYDGATTYFAKYPNGNDPSGNYVIAFRLKATAADMMYLRRADLEQANEDIRAFIKASNPNGKSAKY